MGEDVLVGSLGGLLLGTKLSPPQLRARTVLREGLLAELDESALGKLSLLVAPAGFGKTTLVLQWLQGRQEPVAWLSLDASEDGLEPFLGYLIAALQRLDPALGVSTAAQLRAGHSSSLPALLTPLLNQLNGLPGPFLCVLDDLHHLSDPEVHEALGFLLQHLPAQGHVVITSRKLPDFSLLSLQARGQARLFPMESLRFEPQQTEDFFRNTLGIELSEEEFAALQQRTEGWVTGLQLAGLSLQMLPDKRAVLEGFSGGNPFVGEFLTAEVFGHLPESHRSFLVETSILRRFRAECCDAVRESDDSEEILRSLEQTRCFLIPLDIHLKWYRYHHLFGSWLQHRLGARGPELHLRAARWFREAGQLSEALYHLLESSSYEKAAELLLEEAPGLLKSDAFAPFLRWVGGLPEEVLLQYPKLLVYRCSVLIFLRSKRHYKELQRDLERLAPWLSEAGPKQGPEAGPQQGLRALVEAMKARVQGEYPRCLEAASLAVEALADDCQVLRAQALLMRMTALFRQRGVQHPEYLQELEDGALTALGQGNLAHGLNFARILGWLLLHQGQLKALRSFAMRLHELLEERWASSLPPLAAVILSTLRGELALQEYRLEEAEDALSQSLAAAEALGDERLLYSARIHRAMVDFAQGRRAEALEFCRHLSPPPSRSGSASSAMFWSFSRAMALPLLAGDREPIRQWLSGQELPMELEQIPFERVAQYLVLTRYLAQEQRWDEASSLLEKIRATCQQMGLLQGQLETWLQQALLRYHKGAYSEARESLDRALQLAEPEGQIYLFLREGKPLAELLARYQRQHKVSPAMASFLRRLLEAFSSPEAEVGKGPAVDVASDDLYFLDPLSPREEEILRHVERGLTNQQLASTLHISLSTVKTHIRNIYSKLGVRSRTQALKRARELSLLDATPLG